MVGKPGENDTPANKGGVVYSHRDRILDQMFTEMIEAKWLIGVESDENFRLFVKHFETLRREKVTNNKGIERYIWASTTGEDHFVFSTLYGYLARLGQGSGEFSHRQLTNYLLLLVMTTLLDVRSVQ